MVKKDVSAMSNNDIKLYMQSLKNEYEAKKTGIAEIYNELNEISREYNKAKAEREKRSGGY